MKEKILYIKLKEKAKLSSTKIRICDVARIMCNEDSDMKRVGELEIVDMSEEVETAAGHKIFRKVITVFDIIKSVNQLKEDWEMVFLGDSDMIVEYDLATKKSRTTEAIKLVLVCILVFFGAAFTIMAFNNDISITGVFEQVYLQATGRRKPQVSELEVAYSIGLFLGITVFFNHVGNKKLTNDVTPIEVELNKHNKDRMDTIISMEEEK